MADPKVTPPGTDPSEEGSVPLGLAELEQERDDYLDALQRLKAEFDNFRKRTAREHEAMSARANEALLAQPADDAEPGAVLQVLQKGYRLGDRVLRPARVVVAE